MATTDEINRLEISLDSLDVKQRDDTASLIADIFESNELNEVVWRRLVAALMKRLAVEKDPTVLESIYYALASACTFSFAQGIDLAPVVTQMPTLGFQCLEHSLVILGFAGQQQYFELIRHYLQHPDKDVRRAAREALSELAGRKTE